MDKKVIKGLADNYEYCSIEDIKDIIIYITEQKKQELGIDFEIEIDEAEEGACVCNQRTEKGLQKVVIGCKALADLKENKEKRTLIEIGEIENETPPPEVLPEEERKTYIELILSIYHEFRHVKQIDEIQDHPISNEETKKMTRERVINDSLNGFVNHYNYESSMLEIDAMRASLKETADFFKEMDSDITPDEIFDVMKEKEMVLLKFDTHDFGESFETAIKHFDDIYGKIPDIKGRPEDMLNDKSLVMNGKCKDLLDRYYTETDVDKKMDLLEELSLQINPELREEYPLIDIQKKQVEETKGKPTNQLTKTYNSLGINESDLRSAYDTISRTKNEREIDYTQVQDEPNKGGR